MSVLLNITAPLDPHNVLCVVEVTISAYSNGEFNNYADINPAVWLISANNIVFSPIAYLNSFQSISLQ